MFLWALGEIAGDNHNLEAIKPGIAERTPNFLAIKFEVLGQLTIN